jgi:hypothetical protein
MRRNVRPRPNEPETKVKCECGDEIVTLEPGSQLVPTGDKVKKHECNSCGRKTTVRWEEG